MRRNMSGIRSMKKAAGIALVDVVAAMSIIGTMVSDGAERSKVSERGDIAQQYVQDINNLVSGCRSYAAAQATGFAACSTFANVSASPHLSDNYGDGTTASPEGTGFTFTGSTASSLVVNATFVDAAICEYNEGVWQKAGYDATCTATAFQLTTSS